MEALKCIVFKRNILLKLFCLLFAAWVGFFIPVQGAFCFNTPEKLVYDLTWAGIKAGTATLEVVNDKDTTRIISTALSNEFVSVFYPVNDRVETRIHNAKSDSGLGLPQVYRIQLSEGKRKRDKEVFFDHEKKEVTYINYLENEKKKFQIEQNTFDPLSSFYYVRMLALEVGKSVFVEIFDNRKLLNVEVQVLRKERIRTQLGTFDTIVIKPLMKSEGIFNRKGDLHIWLTDDAKRVPVKMQTQVAVGSITATLTGGNY